MPDYDVVIIGSGGGALCAALAVKALGGEPLITEKQTRMGGSTALSSGIMWVPNNPLLRENGVEDSFERALTYLNAVVPDEGPATSPERRRAFLETGPRMVKFLQDSGVIFEYARGWSDYYDDRPGGEPRGRSLHCKYFDRRELGSWADRLVDPPRPFLSQGYQTGKLSVAARRPASALLYASTFVRSKLNKLLRRPIVGLGTAMQGRILKACKEAGVEVWTGTPVTGFVTEGRRVVGVTAARNGEQVEIRARRGVLIAAGGFAHNRELRMKYGPQPASVDWTVANPGDTGDMHEAASKLGAAMDMMDNAWWLPASVLPDGRPQLIVHERGKPHGILVDSNGERFVNESASYVEVGIAMYERHKKAGAVPSWIVFDRRHRNRYPWGFHVPLHTPRQWIKSGYLKRAATLAELADQCGIDAAGLTRTVERFNGFARRGVDEDFHRGERQYDKFYADPGNKPNATLGTIEKAPFYAVALYPGDVGTAGGMVTDEFGRVIHENGAPIEGLYATGNSTASLVGHTYPAAGASIAASMVFGVRAAEHAMGGGTV